MKYHLKNKDYTISDRFNVRVDKTDTCWLWTGAIDAYGYGDSRPLKDSPEGRAHRLSWHIHNGPIPEGMYVLHKCDNPPCVNPEHLFLGSQKENMADAKMKGRNKYIKRRGEDHPRARLTREDVEFIRTSDLRPKELQERFGITYSHVWGIRNGKTWKDA